MKKYGFYKSITNNYAEVLFSYKRKQELGTNRIYFDLDFILDMCKRIRVCTKHNYWIKYGDLWVYPDWMQFYGKSVYEFEAEDDEEAIKQIRLLKELGELNTY